MRTTVDFPDPLLRRLKSQAALDGVTLKSLIQNLVERGLAAPVDAAAPQPARHLPSIRLGKPLAIRNPSNAGLFELVDDKRGR